MKTDIPARLDRLPWSRFHLLMIVALGITWILDGLEVTIVGSIGPALQSAATLSLSASELGAAGSAYVIGAVGGALLSGWVTDRYGRRRVFYLTLCVYLVGVAATALSWNFWSFALFRALTGAGIGGEYSAVNSAIDELIPARYRGRIDLMVNGSFWFGAAAGAAVSLVILNPHWLPAGIGWRVGFGLGAVLGLSVLALRRLVPESPRWSITHCHGEQAERTMREIEQRVVRETGAALAPVQGTLEIHPRRAFGLGPIFRSMLGTYRRRSLLSFVLMTGQAFLYNAVFSTYGLILTHFYHVPSGNIGLYMMTLAFGNLTGPLLLGPLFDTIGRRRMIAGTFILSALLLLLTAMLFGEGVLTAATQTAAWMVIFFFASAAASSAYLTVSEIFPLEVRALAIALAYASGTAVGGGLSPLLFGWLIGSGERWHVAGAYALAALLMLGSGVTEIVLGVDAERRSLEAISEPLASAP
ncbi:MAG TPA: MFS transporter [Steroidobacteraceae bacterium]|nr:MFS transporter [Steroidobacteraceae bacterium]